jgi:hypothetical protein
MPDAAIPKCPLCRSAQHVRIHGPKDFTCLNCRMDFDGIDDGTISYGPPDRRLRREERREQRRAVRP